MKHKGQTFQYQEQFSSDLLRTYKRTRALHLNRYGRINRYLLFKTIANSPAERFYTSEEQASRVIFGLLNGKQFPKMKPLTREMYYEILSRVRSRQKRHPSRSLRQIVEEVISEPAPKFYLTPSSCETKINRIKNGHHNRNTPPADPSDPSHS